MSSGVESALIQRLSGNEFPDVVVVYLFGSVAEGRAHRESDVDVAVLLDRKQHPSVRKRFERRLELIAALSTTTAGHPLDLVVLNDLPPLFVRRIVLEGKRIFCADPEAAHAFERDVQLRAADLAPFLRRMERIKLEGLRSS